MKKLFNFAFILFHICYGVENLQAQKVITKSIEYDVPIFSEYANENDKDTEWWKNNLKSSVRTYLTKTLLEKAKNGTIKIYDDKGIPIDVANTKENPFFSIDTFTFQQNYPPYDWIDSVVTRQITNDMILFLRFRETWIYDLNTFLITKIIDEYAPVCSNKDLQTDTTQDATNLKLTPLFWVKCKQQSDIKKYIVLTDLVESNTLIESTFPNEPEFYNLVKISRDSFSRKAYISEFCDSAQFGSMEIYQRSDVISFFLYGTDSLKSLTKNEKELLFRSHSEMMPDPEGPPWDFYDTVIYKPFDPSIISILRFFEKWMVDPTTMEIRKEVLGITPVQIKYEKDSFGMMPLFTVFFTKPKREFSE